MTNRKQYTQETIKKNAEIKNEIGSRKKMEGRKIPQKF